VHSRSLSIAGGFIFPIEFENMMVLAFFRLAFLERDADKP
jgi:hypothetical protein